MKVHPSTWLAVGLVAIAATGCQVTGGHNLPPSERIMHPGPGVGGPGPGVLMMPSPTVSPASYEMGGEMALGGGGVVGGADCGVGGALPGGTGQEIQVLFSQPQSMQVHWDSGSGHFDSMAMVTPARQNFAQGGIYRLKITHIPGHEGVELYPTLEIGPGTMRTAAFLAHNAIPVQFTPEDLDQVATGNFVTKVLYLPDPEFQELALAGVETLVSTRLDPGLDPIVEADRRGTILAVIRIGNKDLETPGGIYGEGNVIQDGVIPASYEQGTVAPAAALFGQRGACGDAACGGAGACGSGACGNVGMGMYGGANNAGGGGIGLGTVDLPPGGMPPGLLAQGYPPQYGMPFTGTPIGLPGPPHVPLGVPAGLQKHIIRNHTRMSIPDPTRKVKLHVRQRPGLSYPQPASRGWITEDTIHPQVRYPYRHFGIMPNGQVHYNCR